MARRILHIVLRVVASLVALPLLLIPFLAINHGARTEFTGILYSVLVVCGYCVGGLFYFARTGNWSHWAGGFGVAVLFTQFFALYSVLIANPNSTSFEIGVWVVSASLALVLLEGLRRHTIGRTKTSIDASEIA